LQKDGDMQFERLLENGRLWAVVYDEENVNVLEKVFSQWNDYLWLRDFFTEHAKDLASYFHITDIDRAVFDTVDDANDLECLIMDLDPDANLDELFRPLENTRMSEVLLGREKAKGRHHVHSSWLRLYAIRLESGRYIITGGAIKLTAAMKEREHTLMELTRLNRVRDYLISLGIYDYKGFEDYNEDEK
jgi:hypothetical protein